MKEAKVLDILKFTGNEFQRRGAQAENAAFRCLFVLDSGITRRFVLEDLRVPLGVYFSSKSEI